MARAHADVQLLARGDQVALERLRIALHDADPTCLADRETDVHGVGALVDRHRGRFSGGQRVCLGSIPI